ncbi:unnamed protein product [Enterobius vermicularis]|uniref:BTB domain-containing protein n=1 Tax=Enterobius vermicularis TaxID=51028 RepID=A0A0N4VKM8_ENTVE|nr:unnamed protein product [Enterobius vermicularis]
MPQPFTNFDEEVDTGVMCQICDCWLSGRREFDRHCEQRHPIVVDADSTTVVHSYDQPVTPPSAFLIHSPNSDIGSSSSASYSPATSRKRNRYSSPGDSSSSSGKSNKHLCLACGRYYSSEWNLERHKRESCPLKTKRSKVNEEKSPKLLKLETLELPPLRLSDTNWVADCHLIIGDSRVAVSKTVLSTSSTYFASLFQYYEGKNEVPLSETVDPSVFSLAMDVFNGQQNLDESSIDFVMFVADKFGIKSLYEKCESFVAEKLPASSVMHAIRLADEYNMLDLKNALFSSISIDVFRGLSADRDYCSMEPKLKAELLEKWGTFL